MAIFILGKDRMFPFNMRLRRKVCVVWLFTVFFLVVVMVSMRMHSNDFDDYPDVGDTPLGLPKITSFLLNDKQKQRLTKVRKYRENLGRTGTRSNTKYILLFNELNGAKDWSLGLGNTLFKQLRCPVNNCAMMWGRSKLKYSSAVAFNVPELISVLPKRRPSNQMWIFFSLEPKASIARLPEYWKRQFNWTMSYSSSSDFKINAENFTKRQFQKSTNWAAAVGESNKLVAWFINSCETAEARMNYVQRIQNILPVDIYGKCGRDGCPVRGNKEECERMLSMSYKFYLTFEESLCGDYLSERTISHSKSDISAIVRLGENQRHQDVPQNSYIDATDFESPESLGRYLLYLDKHPKEHAKYLEWRNTWESRDLGVSQSTWCEVCKSLHFPPNPETKVDPYDIWFNTGNKMCWDSSDL